MDWARILAYVTGLVDQVTRVDQPLVIAVAWPEHHAVLAEGDRLSIEVSGNVADRQDCHDAG